MRVADLDLELGAGVGLGRCDVRHGDRDAECRRLRPTGDGARQTIAGMDRVPVTGDAATLDSQPDQPRPGAIRGDSLERYAADEVARLVQLDHAAQAGIER